MITSMSDGTAILQSTRNPRGFWSDDNFLTQIMVELKRRVTLLNLVFTNKEEQTGSVKIKGSFVCSDHGMVELGS